MNSKKTMRDSLLAEVLKQMERGENVFFISADFGAPALDIIREKFPDKFINIGIAEQNLINVCTGLALEGATVYAYAIAPFVTMRCYEQIRVNIAILSQLRPMNINLIGVGAGFSYEVSGPTHHCLEDISIMRTLPNLEVFSVGDWMTAASLAEYCLKNKTPKYLRFDAKPVEQLHSQVSQADLAQGFLELTQGGESCLLATGFMVHKAMQIHNQLKEQGKSIGVIDIFSLKNPNQKALVSTLGRYKKVISLEEGFVGKGGLDALVHQLRSTHDLQFKYKAMGLKDTYIFHIGSRDSLHEQNELSIRAITAEI